jgi:hypothetical protein
MRNGALRRRVAKLREAMHDAEPTLALAPQVEPDAKLVRGSAVGRYVILGAVGEGGMGVLYRA